MVANGRIVQDSPKLIGLFVTQMRVYAQFQQIFEMLTLGVIGLSDAIFIYFFVVENGNVRRASPKGQCRIRGR
eukprot:1241384-Pyramimonas_sp.AAC.1